MIITINNIYTKCVNELENTIEIQNINDCLCRFSKYFTKTKRRNGKKKSQLQNNNNNISPPTIRALADASGTQSTFLYPMRQPRINYHNPLSVHPITGENNIFYSSVYGNNNNNNNKNMNRNRYK